MTKFYLKTTESKIVQTNLFSHITIFCIFIIFNMFVNLIIWYEGVVSTSVHPYYTFYTVICNTFQMNSSSWEIMQMFLSCMKKVVYTRVLGIYDSGGLICLVFNPYFFIEYSLCFIVLSCYIKSNGAEEPL